jgi:NADH-quinone oxidoreductase subunit K
MELLQLIFNLEIFTFLIGCLIIITTQNILKIIIGLELNLMSLSIITVILFYYTQNTEILLYIFGIFSLSAAETAIGLSLLVLNFNFSKNIQLHHFKKLNG